MGRADEKHIAAMMTRMSEISLHFVLDFGYR